MVRRRSAAAAPRRHRPAEPPDPLRTPTPSSPPPQPPSASCALPAPRLLRHVLGVERARAVRPGRRGRITELRASRSQGTAHTTATTPTKGEAAEAGQPPAAPESPIEWLRINAKQHAAKILQTVKLRAFNPRAIEWQRMHAVAAAFHLQHGHLAIPATAKLDDYAVGAWMRRQRKSDNLNPDQAAKLDALDELWRLEPDWNRSYRRLLAYLAVGGTLDGPANRTGGETDPAFRPGTWLRKQDKAHADGKLTDHQTALLDALTRHAQAVIG
ncbi:helicase associated domain-containing protein [Kitasatospora sp. NPDC101183]|uniref:helicase associated domain-containing protein n=1 Tax=Kitasatospora sp. NPDC101183 TaxID=3364100 RepID=UPI0037F686A4